MDKKQTYLPVGVEILFLGGPHVMLEVSAEEDQNQGEWRVPTARETNKEGL